MRTVSYFNEAPSPAKIVSSLINEPLKALSALTGSSVEARSSPAALTMDLFGCRTEVVSD